MLHVDGDASDPLVVARDALVAHASECSRERTSVEDRRSAARAAVAERFAMQLETELGPPGDPAERRRDLVARFDAMKLEERDAEKAARHWFQYEKRSRSTKPSERADAGWRRTKGAAIVIAARVCDVGVDEKGYDAEIAAIDARAEVFRADRIGDITRVDAADFATPVTVPGHFAALLPYLLAGKPVHALLAVLREARRGTLQRPFRTLHVLDETPLHPALRAQWDACA